MNKTYSVVEVFASVQGEGFHVGTPAVFVRFAGCNLRCAMQRGPKSPGGFECDTDWRRGVSMTASQLMRKIKQAAAGIQFVVITGGEPGLQLDQLLVDSLHAEGFRIAIETNGTVALPTGIDWIAMSPKRTDVPIVLGLVDELRLVCTEGTPWIPTTVSAAHIYISPAFDGNKLDPKNLANALRLLSSETFSGADARLSIQLHKLLGVK